jgi:uncharacterized protein YjiS (DUF1127 family)
MSVMNLVLSARRAFSEWRRRERVYGELMSLDDHSLADIGIHRSQIGGLVAGVGMPDPTASAIPLPRRQDFARHKEA